MRLLSHRHYRSYPRQGGPHPDSPLGNASELQLCARHHMPDMAILKCRLLWAQGDKSPFFSPSIPAMCKGELVFVAVHNACGEKPQ